MKKLILMVAILGGLSSFKSEQSPSDVLEREINSNWTFKEINGEHKGRAVVPGTIHTDLIANKLIEDPFYRTNEEKLQWIDKKDWEYATILTITSKEFAKNNIVLNFEGLDTYADVYLNDKLILQANNMFRTWEINVKPLVKLGANQLRVLLHSPVKKGLEILAASPYAYPANNDQSELGGLGDKKLSVFTRKAGYHYGWDWGPRLVTSGIWRPVTLKAWNGIRITDSYIKQPKVTKELANIVADVKVQIDAPFSGTIQILDPKTKKVYTSSKFDFKAGLQTVSLPFAIKKPKLWWSKGLGNPNLYQFDIVVTDNNNNRIGKKEVTTGLRSLKLIREKDSVGESFLFELNGVRLFIKGANYIPNDSFLPRVTKGDYQKVIKDASDANMNMLRVWGGGVYEDDYFYKLCDENGLLVWQDFMFACAMYPGDAAFLANIKQEAIDNVTRLRNHPSIALWCGNNEINTAWHFYSKGGWGWTDNYTKAQQEVLQKTYLAIFQEILPTVIADYTEGDNYWPSSPQAGYEPQDHANYENTSGDMHYWGVWHGQHPFEDFEKYKARFMSEYGFQSFPDFETVKKYTIPEDYDIESKVMSSHQRSGIGNLRIKEYMELYYKMPKDFEDYLYRSQVLQTRALKIAIEAHRGAMPYCMGSMYWQINDCWPVASWSSTDYYHKWKAGHYAIKKAYEPLIITAKGEGTKIVIKGVSDLLSDSKGLLKLSVLDFNGKELFTKTVAVNVLLNSSTKILEIERAFLLGKNDSKKVVLKLEFSKNTKVVAENIFYFEKPKDIQFEKPEIKTELVNKDGKLFLEVSTNTLVKDLYLNFPNQQVFLSDNYFDLLPNEKKIIEITTSDKLEINKLEIKHL
ncbi:MAG: hypothetical protein RLZZ540_390 [Bacteroidota bacterium]|jgi:beta-mannosidase